MFYYIWATRIHINIIFLLINLTTITLNYINHSNDDQNLSYQQIIQAQGIIANMFKCKSTNSFWIMFLIVYTFLLPAFGKNFLFLGLAVQLYLPGNNYSALTVAYSTSPLESKRFNITISLSFNQTAESHQSNSVFDLITCSTNEAQSCLSCFSQNYEYLKNRYQKYEPCMETCNMSFYSSYTNYTLLQTFLAPGTPTPKSNINGFYLIDNTYFPCSQGAYQPQLYLEQFINISIQQDSAYGVLTKIVFVLLVQFMMIIIAYLVIMFRKYRKLKKKLQYIKGQQQAQDLLNSFLTSPNK